MSEFLRRLRLLGMTVEDVVRAWEEMEAEGSGEGKLT